MSDLREAIAVVVRSSKGKAGTRSATLERPQARELRQGDRFKLHPDCCRDQRELDTVWEVVRVSAGSATVRPLSTRRVEIKDPETGAVKASWDAPGGVIGISRQASVLVLDAR